MSQNVAEVLEGKQSTLYEKLAQNNDLANVIMAFIGRIVIMCQEKGKPIQGVYTSEVNESLGDFRFSVEFNTLVITPPGLWQPQGDLLSYAKSKSVHLAKALESNMKMVRTFIDLVEKIEKFCERKHIPFNEFKLKKAFIDQKNNMFVLRSGIPEFKNRFK